MTRDDSLSAGGVRILPHVHKALAALVVSHTLHRLFAGGLSTAPRGPLLFALTCHLLLSASAFVFHVPARTKVPHVLDGLYRAQVLCFTARSVLVMVVVLYAPPAALLLRFVAVAGCHLGADAAQRALGDSSAGSAGVRRQLRSSDQADLERPWLGQWMVAPGRLFFSVAQLNATSQLLYAASREYVLLGAFWTMGVIQYTAFLMTLRKKGLLPPSAWKLLYAAMLASVAASMVRAVHLDELARICAVSLAFAAARLGLGLGKYPAMAAVTALAVWERGLGLT